MCRDLAGGQSLREAMAEVRPSLVAFLISFVVVAISWAGHRDLFAHIRRTDRNLVWLNVLYLLPLSLLPFEPVSPWTKTVGAIIADVPAVLYTLAILLAPSSPTASLAIYAGVPALYFIGLFVERSTAPPEFEEDDF
jgi:uncharacterized membrane protein